MPLYVVVSTIQWKGNGPWSSRHTIRLSCVLEQITYLSHLETKSVYQNYTYFSELNIKIGWNDAGHTVANNLYGVYRKKELIGVHSSPSSSIKDSISLLTDLSNERLYLHTISGPFWRAVVHF